MATLFHVRLVRHGETDTNVQRIIESHSPTPLNELGRRQADALGAAWRAEGATFRLVVSSDTTRALETCRRVLAASECAAPAPRTEPLLREREGGAMDGRSYEEAARMQEESSRTQTPIPGMETFEAAQRRAGQFFAKLVEEVSTGGAGAEGGGEVAVFSHGHVLYCLLVHLQKQYGLQIPPEMLPVGKLNVSWNTGQTRLLVQRDDAGVVSVQCEFLHRDDHLTGDLAPTVYLMPGGTSVPRK